MTIPNALVEREAEVASLGKLVRQADEGSGCFVVVEGLAGIGKSSLLAAAGAIGESIGARVLASKGTELEHELSFSVVGQLFGSLLASVPDKVRDELLSGAAAKAAPAVLGPPSGVSEPVTDIGVIHGLYWLVADLCQPRTTVLLIDDLHWADPASLRFLAYLQQRLEGLRLAVVTAVRPHEPGAAQHLLDILTTDTAATLIRPNPLSPAGTSLVLSENLVNDPDSVFAATCYRATGGNPLMVKELARSIADEGLPPTAESAGRVEQLGSRALGTRIARRMLQLPPDCVALAKAVALLGDGCSIEEAAGLSGMTTDRAVTAAQQLKHIQILQAEQPAASSGLSFVHPLVRSAVYDGLDWAEQTAGHAAAARLLSSAGADAEHIATHLMRVVPAADPLVVETLQRAADSALARGSPETAVTYLERCLREPPAQEDRFGILNQLGLSAQAVDNRTAVHYLEQALQLSSDRVERARIAQVLGDLYLLLQRFDDAVAVWRQALAQLPDHQEDTFRQLQSGLVSIATLLSRRDMTAEISKLRALPFHDSAGGRALECMIAGWLWQRNDPQSIPMMWRGLSGDVLLDKAPGGTPLANAFHVLVSSDDDRVMDLLERAIAQAYHRGAVKDLTAGLTFRTCAHLNRGDLVEAEADGQQCMRAVVVSQMNIARPFIGPYMAQVLIEQGRLAEAEATLAWVGLPDPLPGNGPFWNQRHCKVLLM